MRRLASDVVFAALDECIAYGSDTQFNIKHSNRLFSRQYAINSIRIAYVSVFANLQQGAFEINTWHLTNYSNKQLDNAIIRHVYSNELFVKTGKQVMDVEMVGMLESINLKCKKQ